MKTIIIGTHRVATTPLYHIHKGFIPERLNIQGTYLEINMIITESYKNLQNTLNEAAK